MKTIEKATELKHFLAAERLKGKRIGLVPTMGALHEGHLSLVKRCIKENDICVVSDFVNPTQFNNLHDLSTYPHTLEQDCTKLKNIGCHYLFAPSVEEIYPEPDTRQFDLGQVANVMEGEKRPGHFNGVAQIVSILFDIVQPDNAYFGEKDFQQIAVIREMVKQLKLKVNIVACPILREQNGLALSSRNVRLTSEMKQKAPIIARTLKESTNFASTKSVREVMNYVIDTINSNGMEVEYFKIVDGNSLQNIEKWSDTPYAVGCITVYCGEVRLIDNIKY